MKFTEIQTRKGNFEAKGNSFDTKDRSDTDEGNEAFLKK